MLRATLDAFCPSRCTARRVRPPARLPAGEGRGGASGPAAPAQPGSRDAAGRRSAADPAPARRVEKYQPRARGAGARRGAEKYRRRAAENKDGPTAAPRPPRSRALRTPKPHSTFLVFQPFRDPESEDGVRGGLWLDSPASLWSCPGTPGAQPTQALARCACRPGARRAPRFQHLKQQCRGTRPFMP